MRSIPGVEVHVVAGDLVSGELDLLPDMEYGGVRVQEALDFFGCDDASALFVFKDVDDAFVATAEFAQLLLEGEEEVLVQAPVEECPDAVYVFYGKDCELSDLGEGLVECGDGAVFGIHVHEYVDDFAFFERELILVAREQDASTGFEFQIVALRHDGVDTCAVDFSDFHNWPFRSFCQI